MHHRVSCHTADVAIVGGGAAGLTASTLIARVRPEWHVVILESASSPAKKLLLTGGGRCNITNRTVMPDDFEGAGRHAVRKVLAAFTVEQTVALFAELGVAVHEEENGKLFPDSGNAHTVRNALIEEARRLRIDILAGHQVSSIHRTSSGFAIETPAGSLAAPRLLLATGGLSYPRTGSDGSGYALARSLGHTLVAATPALVPLVLSGRFHRNLAGISHEVEIRMATERRSILVRGPLLWTHFGVSGPAVLDISCHWARAALDGLKPRLWANLVPGERFETLDRQWLQFAHRHPRTALHNALATWLPAKVGDAVIAELRLPGSTHLAHLPGDDRRTLLNALLAWPLPVTKTRGFDHAEVTAGGVPLKEVNPATMESRICPGLHLAGEMLDVTGRVGGFNLQWAWSSAAVAARGIVGENTARR